MDYKRRPEARSLRTVRKPSTFGAYTRHENLSGLGPRKPKFVIHVLTEVSLPRKALKHTLYINSDAVGMCIDTPLQFTRLLHRSIRSRWKSEITSSQFLFCYKFRWVGRQAVQSVRHLLFHILQLCQPTQLFVTSIDWCANNCLWIEMICWRRFPIARTQKP